MRVSSVLVRLDPRTSTASKFVVSSVYCELDELLSNNDDKKSLSLTIAPSHEKFFFIAWIDRAGIQMFVCVRDGGNTEGALVGGEVSV